MDSRTRLTKAFDLELPDRPPILDGWLAAPNHIQTLTGCSDDEYWADPRPWTVKAERILGTDGMVDLIVPVKRGDFRCVDEKVLEERASYTLESVVAEIEALPEPEEIRATFDEDAAYAQFLADFNAWQALLGDIVWCPADWDLLPKALMYHRYGYEPALVLPLLHPQQHLKMMRVNAERGRQLSVLRARAIREAIHPRAILTGEDMCSQRGPMISPEFLRRDYFRLLEYIWEPLLDAGARLVWHSDGDVRPILGDLLACGISGLQGFQTECGMDLEWIVDLRPRSGDPLLIFGPMSVTRTLTYGTTEDVRAEVRRAMRLCRDKASLVFITSNTVTPDVPLDNVRAYRDEVLASRW